MTIISRVPQNSTRKFYPILTLFLLVLSGGAPQSASAQNVGIGTSYPQKKLSIAGSVLVDQGNKNFGSLDSAALVFGTTGGTGISSRKTGSNLHDLRFWTGGQPHLWINSQGRVGIGSAPSDAYKLNVNGSGYFQESVRALGSIRADQYMSVNGNIDPNFRLRVYGGNSRFGGNAEVTGTLNATNIAVADNLTIGGKGAVKSNGTSPLKIHFTSVSVHHLFTGSGETVLAYVNLPDFSNIDDIRLSISHFESNNSSGFNPQNVITLFTEMDPAQNRAALVLRSIRSSDFLISGTFYVTAIMKDN